MANFQIKDLSSDSNPLGTDLFLKSSGNGALTKITFSDFKESLQGKTNNSLAIVASGNTHAAISAGQYVYVKDHSSLTEGLYTANSSIGTNAALSSSNLTAVSSGGFNKLKGEIDSLNSKITQEQVNCAVPTGCSLTENHIYKSGKLCVGSLAIYIADTFSESYIATIAKKPVATTPVLIYQNSTYKNGLIDNATGRIIGSELTNGYLCQMSFAYITND